MAEPSDSRPLSSQIRSRQGVRDADARGPAATLGPRLQAELDAFVGLSLSEFAVSRTGVRFIFREQDGSAVQREILSSEEDFEITTPEAELGWVNSDSDVAVLAYLAALNTKVTLLQVEESRLRLVLDHGLDLTVGWNTHYEGWEIRSGDALRGGSLIVCVPGGELSAWYTMSPP